MQQEGSQEQEKEIKWEEIRQQYIEKIKEWAIANKRELTEEEIEQRSKNTNNFHQYFAYSRKGKKERRAYFEQVLINGYPVPAPEGENETILVKDRLKQFEDQEKQAEGPQDFFSKPSEKFLNTPVAEFFRDIDEALTLTGVTREDLEKENYKAVYPDKNIQKESKGKITRAYQYLVITKGYNYHDLAS